MKRITVVYDDTAEVGAEISNFVGSKSFGEIVFKQKSLKTRLFEKLEQFDTISEISVLSDDEDILAMTLRLKQNMPLFPLFHIFSNTVAADDAAMNVLMEKIPYAKENLLIQNGELLGIVFCDAASYTEYLTRDRSTTPRFEPLFSNALASVGNINGMMQFLTSGFVARFFNSMDADDYTVTKRSANIKKIKSEYMYYRFLPDDMKMWFVAPFDYKETQDSASYCMERYHIADIALKWVNNAIDEKELRKIVERLFHFITTRAKKTISPEQYRINADTLYLEKLSTRATMLKESEVYPRIKEMLEKGTPYKSIDEVFDRYKSLYQLLMSKHRFEPQSVIGHGDLCFSNILYHGSTSIMKFIDVKGALTEEEMWCDPYYDLAKLSHSLCGNYDFLNNGMYRISLDEQMYFKLDVFTNNTLAVKVFQEFLAQNGFDYVAVRLFEASLFLTMLPLHIDYPRKVFGFLLNGIEILNEVEQCLKK